MNIEHFKYVNSYYNIVTFMQYITNSLPVDQYGCYMPQHSLVSDSVNQLKVFHPEQIAKELNLPSDSYHCLKYRIGTCIMRSLYISIEDEKTANELLSFIKETEILFI